MWGWIALIVGGSALAGVLLVGVAVTLVYPSIPDVRQLADYQPKLPLRVLTADGVTIGEFGEERRQLVPLDQIPMVMRNAVLAAEDARFYEHGGIDTVGLMRAIVSNTLHGLNQGASTITQQVAKNVYLTPERTFSRKLREAIIALRLEDELSKDQIFTIYLNQIYLGQRAYGFAAASEAYFGKPIANITVAEAAMLAGLPKAPGANNPVVNPRRARARQLWVIERMESLGFITHEQAELARQEKLKLRADSDAPRLHAEYVAEMVRQQMVAQYGESAYTRGLTVTTAIDSKDQTAAWQALRNGLLDYERRQPWRGPEQTVSLPDAPDDVDDAVDEALAAHPGDEQVESAVVLKAEPKKLELARRDGSTVTIDGAGLRLVQGGLSSRADARQRVARGAILRIVKNAKGDWEVVQLPEVEGAFVAMNPQSGAVKAMVGGFDFARGQFNRVTQAWRQPGSSFKPFIYSAALEKGFAPSTVVEDGPLFFDRATTGGQPWEPKNYDGGFEGPMTLREALQKSKNMVTIRVLQSIGTNYAQDWVTRFGFDADKQPPYLPMALGAGSVTPMQMAVAYSVFANGGYRVTPLLVTKVVERNAQVLFQADEPALDESMRAIPARNAFIMRSLLQSVVKNGTGSRAYRTLRREDLYGKTGTTNDSYDTWFAGFQPSMVGIAWIGYDNPRQLGVRGETGGSLSLPVWTSYMQTALKGVPVAKSQAPDGVAMLDGEWYYDDYPPGRAVASLGVDSSGSAPFSPSGWQTVAPGSVPGFGSNMPAEAGVVAPAPPPANAERRKSILDLFR
ncbi:penicillin-binding protein 1A [Variovorax dokdonensis]|uniref:Penicillin-binding protein 1A n=1 Tax=Variovorax dokdonensis TaxID=344883 RepID=A0ABT7NFM6_9BURK|nr:penicillin-binding protein 1A [Variovorax dokdonensis]